ncbi:hypothetical protein [Cytophaga aurantiaca]|uniref:hypothetical protein n=1 Tax=Cytophaga aurantiaca TaxID=29530 RepID=UPI00036709DA|nr:hypothetical protein [Cytophaga aurantiaca]
MKNKKQAYTIFLLLTSVALVLGSCRKEKIQPEQANSFIKYYGKGGTQKAGNVALTPDGGYVLVGTTDSYGDGKQILVIKTDKFGNEEWNKVLGGAGDDEGNWIEVATDGGYVVVGSKAESASSSSTDVWIVKLNSDGTQYQEFTYGNLNFKEKGNKILLTNDQGYIVIGSTTQTIKAVSAVYLVKVDPVFTKEWEAIFGVDNAMNVGTAIQQLKDSVYLTSASTYLPSTSQSNILITTGKLKIDGAYDATSSYDKNGAIVEPNIANAVDILSIPGSAFVLGNTTSTSNSEIYIMKLNISTSSVSKNYYKEFGTARNDIATDFSLNADGGFIITGSTIDADNGMSNVLVMRTDSQGNVLWTKQFGGSGNDYGASAKQTADGSFIVSATIQFGGNATGSNSVMSLIHLTSNGELK